MADFITWALAMRWPDWLAMLAFLIALLTWVTVHRINRRVARETERYALLDPMARALLTELEVAGLLIEPPTDLFAAGVVPRPAPIAVRNAAAELRKALA